MKEQQAETERAWEGGRNLCSRKSSSTSLPHFIFLSIILYKNVWTNF